MAAYSMTVSVTPHQAQRQQPAQQTLTVSKRIRQYQPSRKLVTIMFGWWLFIVLVTALQMTNGFGSTVLAELAANPLNVMGITRYSVLEMIGLLTLLVIGLAAVLDLLCLLSISQPSKYGLSRQHPSNVPVYHQLEITDYLSYTPSIAQSSMMDKVVSLLTKSGYLSHIDIDYYEDYPDNLTLIEPFVTGDALDSLVGEDSTVTRIMPIRVALKVDSASTTDATSVSAMKTVVIKYPVMAVNRGTGYFGAAAIRVWSPLALFKRQFTLSTENDKHNYLRVLADFSGLLSNQLSAVFERSVDSGMQSLLQQGSGSDFLKLREYSPGDAMRQIDWKASSRQHRLMSKSYEDDNNQDVVFLLDCGEQMRHQQTSQGFDDMNNLSQSTTNTSSTPANQGSSYFDKVLNAVLLLSYVANKQGDNVGLMTFAGDRLYLPPKKGVSLIRNMLNATADLNPSMMTSDYVTAAQTLLTRVSKRSLVVVITNTRAEASDALTQALKLLGQRHQVVFANLTEQTIEDRLNSDSPPTSFDDALLYHALIDYQQSRQQLHRQLSQQTGALCLQSTANQLPLHLTHTYMTLKRH